MYLNEGLTGEFIATIDSKTQASGATSTVAQMIVKQEHGLLNVQTVPWFNVGGLATVRSLAVNDKTSQRYPYKLTKVDITKVTIKAITGTAKYLLYGRRKWT